MAGKNDMETETKNILIEKAKSGGVTARLECTETMGNDGVEFEDVELRTCEVTGDIINIDPSILADLIKVLQHIEQFYNDNQPKESTDE